MNKKNLSVLKQVAQNEVPSKPQLHAIIGVWYKGDKTFYVKRSAKMENYPNVWSLLSIQFDPKELTSPTDISSVQPYMDKMSDLRTGGTPLVVKKYLSSARCSKNPINRNVFLYLFEIEFKTPPALNPDFYSDSAWMTPEEYEVASKESTCGLCMRMWSDYCVKTGISNKRFAPLVEDD